MHIKWAFTWSLFMFETTTNVLFKKIWVTAADSGILFFPPYLLLHNTCMPLHIIAIFANIKNVKTVFYLKQWIELSIEIFYIQGLLHLIILFTNAPKCNKVYQCSMAYMTKTQVKNCLLTLWFDFIHLNYSGHTYEKEIIFSLDKMSSWMFLIINHEEM